MKKYRGLIIGFIAGTLFATASGASAAVGDTVDAIFAEFNILVNGQPANISQTPVVINGSSYLPVRSIANALGYDVTYKADSRTIEMVTSSVYAVSPAPSSQPVTSVAPSSSDSGTVSTNTNDGGSTMSATVSESDLQKKTIAGVEYISLRSLGIAYEKYGYGFYFDSSSNTIYMTYNPSPNGDTTQKKTILTGIPVMVDNGNSYVSNDYYTNNILPLVN